MAAIINILKNQSSSLAYKPFPVVELSESFLVKNTQDWHSLNTLHYVVPPNSVAMPMDGQTIGNAPYYYFNKGGAFQGVVIATRWFVDKGTSGIKDRDIYLCVWKINPIAMGKGRRSKKLYKVPLLKGGAAGRSIHIESFCVALEYAVLSVDPPSATCVLIDMLGRITKNVDLDKIMNPPTDNSACSAALRKASVALRGDTIHTPLYPILYSPINPKEVISYGIGRPGAIKLKNFPVARNQPPCIQRLVTRRVMKPVLPENEDEENEEETKTTLPETET